MWCRIAFSFCIIIPVEAERVASSLADKRVTCVLSAVKRTCHLSRGAFLPWVDAGGNWGLCYIGGVAVPRIYLGSGPCIYANITMLRHRLAGTDIREFDYRDGAKCKSAP